MDTSLQIPLGGSGWEEVVPHRTDLFVGGGKGTLFLSSLHVLHEKGVQLDPGEQVRERAKAGM